MPGLKGRRKSGATPASRLARYEGLGVGHSCVLMAVVEVEGLEMEMWLVASWSEVGSMGPIPADDSITKALPGVLIQGLSSSLCAAEKWLRPRLGPR